MVEGKDQADWNHTSHLIAALVNVNRDPKKRAIQPHEFNPYAKKQEKNKEPDFYITPGQLAQKIVGKQQVADDSTPSPN